MSLAVLGRLGAVVTTVFLTTVFLTAALGAAFTAAVALGLRDLVLRATGVLADEVMK